MYVCFSTPGDLRLKSLSPPCTVRDTHQLFQIWRRFPVDFVSSIFSLTPSLAISRFAAPMQRRRHATSVSQTLRRFSQRSVRRASPSIGNANSVACDARLYLQAAPTAASSMSRRAVLHQEGERISKAQLQDRRCCRGGVEFWPGTLHRTAQFFTTSGLIGPGFIQASHQVGSP